MIKLIVKCPIKYRGVFEFDNIIGASNFVRFISPWHGDTYCRMLLEYGYLNVATMHMDFHTEGMRNLTS